MRKTKIVCTIGPASESVDMLVQLMKAGMNVARLNFSHGNHEEHRARIKNIREAAKIANQTVGILLDTKGPEIRTGMLEKGEIALEVSQTLRVSMEDIIGNEKGISVSYPGLINDIEVGSTILLDDGLIALEVTEKRPETKEIITIVKNAGVLKNRKGVNIPNVRINLPGMTEKDAADIEFGIAEGIDFIAASFVRRAKDVLEIRKILEKNNATHIQIIPKIENREGVDNINEILEVSDGLMVARGDLGVEIPAEEVPLVQKELIQKCNERAKPVITATQMLDSMQRNPRPTRAEASDVANAIFDGTDAIMLSGETAAGKYPLEAVSTMDKIAKRVEAALPYKQMLNNRTKSTLPTITDAISQSVSHTAYNLKAKAIITATESGHTARMISKYRPQSPIIAVTSHEPVLRRLSLLWGVYATLGKKVNTTDELLDSAVDESLKTKMITYGDLVVITAGVPVNEIGTTNLLKVHVVGDVLAKGQGVGRQSVYGKVVVANSGKEALRKMDENSILVTKTTDIDMVEAMKKAVAIITEESGLTSHAAIVGLSIGIPVVVGVKNAIEIFEDGQEITVDSQRGSIYQGHASVL